MSDECVQTEPVSAMLTRLSGEITTAPGMVNLELHLASVAVEKMEQELADLRARLAAAEGLDVDGLWRVVSSVRKAIDACVKEYAAGRPNELTNTDRAYLNATRPSRVHILLTGLDALALARADAARDRERLEALEGAAVFRHIPPRRSDQKQQVGWTSMLLGPGLPTFQTLPQLADAIITARKQEVAPREDL